LLLTIVAALVSASCVYASFRRIWFAADATGLDAVELATGLRAAGARAELWAPLRAEVEREPGADWERDLFTSLAAPRAARVALVNEQLAELDYRAQRWARVPRVCASVSSSTGFLLAALAVSAALASDDIDINGVLVAAINVVTIGLCGTAFCVASHLRAGAMMRARLAAADALVERLEAWVPSGDADMPSGLAR
jgi:hypothetical protein